MKLMLHYQLCFNLMFFTLILYLQRSLFTEDVILSTWCTAGNERLIFNTSSTNKVQELAHQHEQASWLHINFKGREAVADNELTRNLTTVVSESVNWDCSCPDHLGQGLWAKWNTCFWTEHSFAMCGEYTLSCVKALSSALVIHHFTLPSWRAALQKRAWWSWWAPSWPWANKCALATKKSSAVLGCIRSITNRLQEVVLSFYSALVRLHLECCSQFWAPKCKRDMDTLERDQPGATAVEGTGASPMGNSWDSLAWTRGGLGRSYQRV